MSDLPHDVCLMVTDGHKLLVSAGDDGKWSFPQTRPIEDEASIDTCRRLAQTQLGCSIATTWFFDTVRPSDSTAVPLDCYVAELADDAASTGKDLVWISKNELASDSWEPSSQALALSLGVHWDFIFMSEHW